jgi:hypothetical protein
MRKTAWILVGLIALVTSPVSMAADSEAAGAAANQIPWARWQGRLSLGSTTPAWRLGVEGPTTKLSSASLMGDYYFGPALTGPGRLGGFRATSGLIVGPRNSLSTGQPSLAANGSVFSIGSKLFGQPTSAYGADLPTDTATVPYLGFGYTGLSPRSGWSFSADLGLVAQSPANSTRLGRALSNGQNLDDAVRDLRLAPLLQLGVSYSF